MTETRPSPPRPTEVPVAVRLGAPDGERDWPVAEPDLPLLHQRTYQVRAYRAAEDRLLLRGWVQDLKPPGLYFPDDPEPLEIHHMVVDLHVEFPTMRIVDAEVVFETHPHEGCPRIVDHYRNLIGLSIARGFTHKVRELFGGPRGCTHVTALLSAMAPVAIQSMWSMQASNRSGRRPGTGELSPEQRRERFRFNLNTCHIWAEDGELFRGIEAGGEMEIPLWARERARRLGRDPGAWIGGDGDE